MTLIRFGVTVVRTHVCMTFSQSNLVLTALKDIFISLSCLMPANFRLNTLTFGTSK